MNGLDCGRTIRLLVMLRKGDLPSSGLYPVELGQGDNDKMVRLLVLDRTLLSLLRR